MNTRKKQQGFSVLNSVIVILLLTFFVTLFVKLGPIYQDNWFLKNIIRDIAATTSSEQITRTSLREQVQKNLTVNNVKFDVNEGLAIRSDVSPKRLVLKYEAQVHVMGNVDAVVIFHDEFVMQP